MGPDEILGNKRWRPFLAAIRDEVVQRIETNVNQLIDLHAPNVREFGAACAAMRESNWPAFLASRFDNITVRRANLDWLTLRATRNQAPMRPRLAHSITETRALDSIAMAGGQGECQAEPPVSGTEPSQNPAEVVLSLRTVKHSGSTGTLGRWPRTG